MGDGIPENETIFKTAIVDLIGEMLTDDTNMAERPLYLAKNVAIIYSEKVGCKFEHVFPIIMSFVELLNTVSPIGTPT